MPSGPRKYNVAVREKRCAKCDDVKIAEHFYLKPSARTGLSSYCRPCQVGTAIESNRRDPERTRARRRLWKQRHRKQSYESDNRRRRRKYPEVAPKIRARVRKYIAANYEKVRAYHRSERGKLRHRLYQQRRIARQTNLPNTLTDAEWAAIVAAFDGLCAYCQKLPWHDVEHIVPISKGGGLTKENVVPACDSCNSSKHQRDFEEFCLERGLDPAAIRARAAAPFASRTEREAA